MKRTQFGELLDEIGIPYAFWEFDDAAPNLPYLIYYDIDPYEFYADDKTYYLSTQYGVEVYTEYKDDALQERIQAFFNAHGMVFVHEPRYIPEEELFQEYYGVTTY